jgi:hypothetical protein
MARPLTPPPLAGKLATVLPACDAGGDGLAGQCQGGAKLEGDAEFGPFLAATVTPVGATARACLASGRLPVAGAAGA